MKGYEFIKTIGNVSIRDKSVCVYQKKDGAGIRVQVESTCKISRGYAVIDFVDMECLNVWLERFKAGTNEAGQVARILDQLRKAA